MLLMLSGIWTVLLSCHSNDTTGPVPLNAAQGVWAIRLNQNAVNMSLTPPYDTFQLAATPVNAAGDTLDLVPRL